MTDAAAAPPPENFPNYQPPNPAGQAIIDAKQQKPLLKLINKRLTMKTKPRVSPVKKRIAKRKKDGQRWVE